MNTRGRDPMNADAPRPVREGEELDLPSLARWLQTQSLPRQAPLAAPSAGTPAAPPSLRVEQFPRGHSNLTYLIHLGDREYVLRRPPRGSKVATAHDMGREARILTRLHPVFPLAPRVVAVCDDTSVLGAPFYLMERIRGAILRGPAPKVDLSVEQVRALCGAFVKTLVALHAVDFHAAGLEGKPQGYVRRQVEGWTRRWHDARTEEVPEVDEVARWLAERIPPERGAAFIHNDYKYDNLVLDGADPTRVAGVLDWEMATVGDPLMDLGTALGYWVEDGDPDELKAFAFGPTFLPGSYTRAQIVEEYGRLSGRDVSGMQFYVCFALFKLIGIVQQIYKRYVDGHTRDERFAAFGFAVHMLAHRAADLATKTGKTRDTFRI